MQLLEILQYIANASCYTTRYQRPYEQSGFHFFSKIVQRERERFIPYVQEYYRETEIKFNIIFKFVALNIEFFHDRYFNLRDAKSHKVIGLFCALSIV